MKKIIIAATVVAALSLLVLGSAIAEPTHPNEIGLYTTPDGYGDTGINVVGEPVDLFLVLTKPAAQNVPVTGVLDFECQLNFAPSAGTMFLLGNILGGDGMNIGDTGHFYDGYLEYIAFFADEVPVTDEAIVLVYLTVILPFYTDPIEVTLGPPSTPSIPGQMSFLPPNPPREIMHSMGGSPEAPVFTFNGMAIPVESESFGTVKALYR